jgi:hypothetical protein
MSRASSYTKKNIYEITLTEYQQKSSGEFNLQGKKEPL